MPRRARRQVPPVPPFRRSIVFERVVPSENCYRRYEIVMVQRSGYWLLTTRRGRIGKTLWPLEETCETEIEARATADRRAHERLLHGYYVVAIDENQDELRMGPTP